ncbi:hypothetical protein BH09PAT2_BH09PAT2_06650 [soil metagenome]
MLVRWLVFAAGLCVFAGMSYLFEVHFGLSPKPVYAIGSVYAFGGLTALQGYHL